ncbi:metallophosphoesterase [Actinomycetes bacterium NPDC127524]
MILLLCLAVIAAASAVMIVIMYRNAFLDRVLSEDLTFPRFPESFGKVTVFFISDIHRRRVTDKLIREVKGKADMVILGGDIREGGVALKQAEDNIIKLKEAGPLYFVWGNNDYEGDYHSLDAMLLDHGVRILDNTAVSFQSEQGEKISLIGIDDISEERDRLDLALSDAEKGTFRILVSHNPIVKKQIEDEHNISLVLSGHTHGGQIRVFGHGPYEIGSIYTEGDCVYLTSNGYGTSTVPLRLGAKPETHIITIRKGEKTSARRNEPQM